MRTISTSRISFEEMISVSLSVVHTVELRAADERDAPADEILMEACIGVSRAVGRNEELCAVEECRVHRHKLYLYRPL